MEQVGATKALGGGEAAAAVSVQRGAAGFHPGAARCTGVCGQGGAASGMVACLRALQWYGRGERGDGRGCDALQKRAAA